MIYFIFFELVISIINADANDHPTANMHNMKIYGNASLGYYYSNFYIGTPPQRQSLILDTGSGIVALPCEQCIECGKRHINPRFRIKQSSSSKILTCDSGSKACKKCSNPNDICNFSIFYAEGSSLEGILVEDKVFASDEIDDYYNRQNKTLQSQQYQHSLVTQSVRTVFGCSTKETHLFVTQKADGIMGLCPVREHNFLQEIFSKHNLYTNQKHSFSLCLANTGGIFTIGGINTILNTQTEPIGIAKYNFNETGQYTIQANQILIDHGNKLPTLTLNVKGICFDSGATFTYFPSSHYHLTIEQLDKACDLMNCKQASGQEYRCYHIKVENQSLEQAMKRFPNITLKLQSGSSIQWQPQQYFLLRNRKLGQVCVGLISFGRYIFGANWLAQKNVFFNLDKNQIEIYKAQCNPSAPKIKNLYQNQDAQPLTQVDIYITQENKLYLIIFITVIILTVFFLAVYYILKEHCSQQNNDLNKVQEINGTDQEIHLQQEMFPVRESSFIQQQQI